MKEKNEELKSEEVKNPTQEVDSKEVNDAATVTEQETEVDSNTTSEEVDTTDSPKEFKIPLEDSERKHYENIITSQKESIRKLREENMELHSKLDSTKTE